MKYRLRVLVIEDPISKSPAKLDSLLHRNGYAFYETLKLPKEFATATSLDEIEAILEKK